MRILLFSFFIFKLLSRDYSIFGIAPPEALNVYTSATFSYDRAPYLLAQPWIVQLASFHWIHWFIPLPGEGMLRLIQLSAIALCFAIILFGRGYKGLFAICLYCVLSYLWGFNWRSGADDDAIFLQLQLVLVYCFFREKEALVLYHPISAKTCSKENGWFYSMTVLVFCAYYFDSGLNKLTDIYLGDWFRYNLMQIMGVASDQKSLGYFANPTTYLASLRDYHFLNYIFVPFSYLMELTIPLMFFYRRLIVIYFLFFVSFHLMTWNVGILFLGNIVAWMLLLPIDWPYCKKTEKSANNYESRLVSAC
jgi:hypothetical protein